MRPPGAGVEGTVEAEGHTFLWKLAIMHGFIYSDPTVTVHLARHMHNAPIYYMRVYDISQ